jgi:hypothetical protein
MAFTAKFTIQRGNHALKNIPVTPGSAEAQSDTISLNVDATHITRGDALLMIDELRQKIYAGNWPPR